MGGGGEGRANVRVTIVPDEGVGMDDAGSVSDLLSESEEWLVPGIFSSKITSWVTKNALVL